MLTRSLNAAKATIAIILSVVLAVGVCVYVMPSAWADPDETPAAVTDEGQTGEGSDPDPGTDPTVDPAPVEPGDDTDDPQDPDPSNPPADSQDTNNTSGNGSSTQGKKSDTSKKSKDKDKNKDKDKDDEEEDEEKEKEIQSVIDRLASLTMELETASEDLNEITEKHDDVERKAEKSKKKLVAAKKRLENAEDQLHDVMCIIYREGDVSYLDVLMGSADFEDFVSKLYLLETIAADRQSVITNYVKVKAELDAQVDEYNKQLQEITSLEEQAQARRKTISESIDAQVALLESLDPDMLDAVNSYDRSEVTREILDKFAGSTSKAGSHPEIVGIAANYLGVPYVWGGETPRGFDCSGLTQYCYRKIGINLTHFARTQYFEGRHIAKSALMPGDLVFFGKSVASIHHVGIYVGDGMFMHAPMEGDVVKVSPLSMRGDFVGACRPY